MRRMTKRLVFVCLTVTVIALLSYYAFYWSTVYASTSSDGARRIEVQKAACIADCVVRVILKEGWRTTTIASGSDCWLSFVQAAWSSPIVGVFVDGRICGQMKVAYDIEARRSVPFTKIESALGNAIVRGYSVTTDELVKVHGDPLVWATYDQQEPPSRALADFRRRYGGTQ
jgi:hypothetical protein